ncbi:MAG TPA: ABC transporter permease [Gemmatimonadaceae bacterium]|nr:ABC transporter permease [Gemmatimonadaceae bacterium]
MRDIRIPGIRRALRASSRRAVDREVDEEIRFHIEARTEELMRLGLSEREASERARAEYGDVAASRRELTRIDQRRAGLERREEMLMTFLDDLSYAARSLSRRPALLIVTTLTLSIGIAANAIMFGVVDQLLLRPPAHVAGPDLVKRIYYRDVEAGQARFGSSTVYPVLTALRASTSSFSDLAAYSDASPFSLGTGRDAQSASVQLVSGNWFRLLGVRPSLGRFFIPDDDVVPHGQPVAILGYGFWQQQFAGDTGALGRSIQLQGKTFTIVGVAPRAFAGIDRRRVDVWLPVSAMADEALGPGWHNTDNHWWAQIIGRLRPAATPEAAAAEATLTYRGFVRKWNDRWRDSTSSIILSSIVATRTPEGITRESRVSLWLMGVSVIVLLIACANVANLLIARTLERRREIAVRMALGIGRGRLVRMLFAEAGLLAFLGSLAALGIWLGASRVVQDVLLPNVAWSESLLDLRVFGFTLGVAVLAMLLAGVAPALQGMSTRVSEGLKASARQVAGGRGRLRFALVLAQAALSVVLLVGAGLTVRSLNRVVSREVGIDRDRVLRVTMPLSSFGFERPQIEEIYRRGMERVRQIPGVTNVAVARLTVPMGSASASSFSVPGVPDQDIPGGGPYNSAVTSGFFRAIGAPLVAGRDFTPDEERTTSRVLIVNEMVARAYWPDASPIGRCAKFGSDTLCSVVVGVVRNVLQFSLIRDDRAIVYAPPSHPGVGDALPRGMLVRVAGDPKTIIPLVRAELQALSPSMPFVTVRPYSELVAAQLQPWRLAATMFALFGVIALVIAAVGLYSVMAYWVSQRRHEIGVRMALGAQRADVVRLVALQSSRAVVAGLILGGVVALVASRWLTDLLYETSARDPVVYGGAALVLGLAAIVASVVPARRSTAVDPAQAIRAE